MEGYVIGYKDQRKDDDLLLGGQVEYVADTDYTPCTYKENQNDFKGIYSEGKFKRYSFEVTIDESFKHSRIQLFDYHKKPITDVVLIEGTPRYLDAVCKTKLYI